MHLGHEAVGYAASGLVLLTFATKRMRPLRIIAILSNFAFISYGAIDGIIPVLGLHLILLPLNVFRLAQIEIALRRDAVRDREIGEPDMSGLRVNGDGVTTQHIEPVGDGRWIVTLAASGGRHPLRLMVELAPELFGAAVGVPSIQPPVAVIAAAEN